ncbi:hypothetical protein BGZ57DRAFT_898297 [Hyaloscypha finlandica]|nr:hypothetical protein BGZ57DRAFT_898297 [Hyaloscypha finlandica]
MDTCSSVSGSLSCSATCTATSTGCDLTGTTTTTTQGCSSQPCQTAVITTIGGDPASSITICPDCEATPTDPGPIPPLYTLPAGIDPIAAPNPTLFTITFVADYIIDTPSFGVDTAAAFAAMQSIDFQQLSFFSGGILTVATTATFAEPAGPLTIPVISNDTPTIAPPSVATTTAEPPTVVNPETHPCQLSSDCPQSNCNSDQTPICAPNGTCLCGSSSLNLGPLGTKVRRAYPTFLKRFKRR